MVEPEASEAYSVREVVSNGTACAKGAAIVGVAKSARVRSAVNRARRG